MLDLLDWRDIEDAVAESAKCHGGVADVGLVGESHLQDGDVANHGGGDGGDEEEACCDEEEGDSDPGSG